MGRLVTERSKEVASIASGAGLPSASGCKDPMYQEVLSLSFAPELCSGAFCLLILIQHFLIGTYPSSRGENKQLLVAAASQRGSSPLTQGKHQYGRSHRHQPGLIPTHAGKTNARTRSSLVQRAHPRSCGENAVRIASRWPVWGSSPLTQGKQSDGLVMAIHERLIPAHAGKPSSGSRRASGGRAHPRSRGENEYLKRGSFISPGSSPLTRGKQQAPPRPSV